MNSRESRIRALAAQWMCSYWSQDAIGANEAGAMAMSRAAECVDAIDALPVPGEARKVCAECNGDGRVWNGTMGMMVLCLTCNGTGTGKAER